MMRTCRLTSWNCCQAMIPKAGGGKGAIAKTAEEEGKGRHQAQRGMGLIMPQPPPQAQHCGRRLSRSFAAAFTAAAAFAAAKGADAATALNSGNS
jgi:hypothetical protein